MEIRDVVLNERTSEVTVTALVDNMKLVRSATWDYLYTIDWDPDLWEDDV